MSNTYNKLIQMPKKHQKAQSASLLFKGMRFNVMLLTLTFIYLTSSSYATAAQHRDIRCVNSQRIYRPGQSLRIKKGRRNLCPSSFIGRILGQ